MVPALVRTSTCGSAARPLGATAAAETKNKNLKFIRLLVFRGVSTATFVNDFPGGAFLHPVLALAHDVRQTTRFVVLVEGDDHEIALSRVAEHRHSRHANLDPLLGTVHFALVRAPGLEVLPGRSEPARIVGEIALGVPALPVGAPLLERPGERGAL